MVWLWQVLKSVFICKKVWNYCDIFNFNANYLVRFPSIASLFEWNILYYTSYKKTFISHLRWGSITRQSSMVKTTMTLSWNICRYIFLTDFKKGRGYVFSPTAPGGLFYEYFFKYRTFHWHIYNINTLLFSVIPDLHGVSCYPFTEFWRSDRQVASCEILVFSTIQLH